MSVESRITYVVQRTLPDPLTGSERYISDLARSLGGKYSAEIIATGRSKSISPTPLDSKAYSKTFKEFPIKYLTGVIPLITKKLGLNKQWPMDLYSKPFDGFLHSSSFGYFSLSMKDYLESHNFQVIHTTAVPTATAWLSWKISRRKKIPLVLTPFFHYELVDFRVPWIKKMLIESSIIIAVTNKEKEKLVEFGVSPAKIRVIPLGIDYRIYSRKKDNLFRQIHGLDEDLFVILVPRKNEDKGTFDTLKAVVNLSQKYNKLGLILLDKTLKGSQHKLAAYIRSLTSNGVKVTDLGWVSGQNLIDAYQASDVLVEPTRTDAFGIVFLEAWACGKPVIAADFGAVSEIVLDNVNGLLVRFGDWQGIEKALISLIDDRKFRTRLGENGKQDVIKKYSIENMVQNTELIYDSII